MKDPRFRYVLAPHTGFIRTLVRGYEEARVVDGLLGWDSDDLCHPDGLRIQMEFLATHPECTFVGSAYGFMSPGWITWLHHERGLNGSITCKPSEITLGGSSVWRCHDNVIGPAHRGRGAGFFDPEFDNENPFVVSAALRMGKERFWVECSIAASGAWDRIRA